jgi:hypothetical protein
MRVRAGLALLLVASLLHAQREPLRQPASIPVELAASLAAAGGLTGEPLILVGEMPGWMSERLPLPSGAVVSGSAFTGMDGLAIIQLLEGTIIPDSAYDAALTRNGWKAWMPSQNEGGFRWLPSTARSVASPPSANRPALYCSGQQTLRISAGSPRQGRIPYVLRVSAATGYGPCNPPVPRQSELRLPPLPILYHPVGSSRITDRVAMSSDCASTQDGFDRPNFTSDYIRSDSSAQLLLDHYAKQLADSGWSRSSSSAVIGGQWRRVDAQGKTFIARLTITTSSDNPTCRSAQLMVREADRP